MQSDNVNSAAGSATTSPSGQSSSAPKPGPAGSHSGSKPSDVNKPDFLARQAADAKDALQAALRDAVGKFGQGVNPTEWAKVYPWTTVGASAVAGFVAASLLVPSKEQQALSRLAAIERALHPAPPKREPEADGHGRQDGKPAAPSGLVGLLIREAVGVLRPILVSLVTAKAAQSSYDPAQSDAPASAGAEAESESAAQSV